MGKTEPSRSLKSQAGEMAVLAVIAIA